jgi:OmpA-OmpF porin, OOP family
MYKHRAYGVAAVLLFASASAHADVYVGVGVGEANQEAAGFDASDTAFKIFGGYTFNRHLAVELAYVDAGAPSEDVAEDVRMEAESSGIVVSAIGTLPLSESFALFGRVGYAFSETSARLRTPNETIVDRDESEDPLYVAGAILQFSESFGLRLEYEFLDLSEGNFNMLSLSALYRF